MLQSLTWWRGLVVAVIGLCLVLAVNASGQDKKGGANFASVDVEKVNADFAARRAIEDQMRALDKRMKDQLDRRNSMPFLSEDEHKQIDAIEAKDAAQKTPADTAKVKELTDKGGKLSADIEALRGTADDKLTQEQKDKLKQAETDFQRAKNQFQALQDEFRATMQKKIDENSDMLMARFREAVKKIGEAKGISIVFNNQVAIYAGTDLTQAVITELNKNPSPTAPAK